MTPRYQIEILADSGERVTFRGSNGTAFEWTSRAAAESAARVLCPERKWWVVEVQP